MLDRPRFFPGSIAEEELQTGVILVLLLGRDRLDELEPTLAVDTVDREGDQLHVEDFSMVDQGYSEDRVPIIGVGPVEELLD